MTSAAAITHDPDDDDPIVVLDDESETSFALCAASQDYLRAQGITDERTWSAFRLGYIDDATMTRCGLTGRRRFTSMGISIPTFDPRDPTTVVGVVRLTPAQNLHRFASAPAGLAGALTQSRRVVLVDHPLLALRLHQAGVHDVALVEDPAVLPPLAEWLAQRELVLASYKPEAIAAMRDRLGEMGTRTTSVVVSPIPSRFSDDVREKIGLIRAEAHTPQEMPALTPFMLRDLHAYAESRLRTADGMSALRTWQWDDPDLLRAYRFGYLPADVRGALSDAMRGALAGHLIPNALIVPAFDDAGAVVDLMMVPASATKRVRTSLWDQPRGLCAPALISAYDHILVTDSVRTLGRYARAGHATVVLRGPHDAAAQAARFVAAGVRQVQVRAQRWGSTIAQVLRDAGMVVSEHAEMKSSENKAEKNHEKAITIPFVSLHGEVSVPNEKPALAGATAGAVLPPVVQPLPVVQPPPLELVQHDAGSQQAIFRFGAAHYTVQIPWGGMTSTQVTVSIGDQRHRDFLNLSMSAQRHRFASCAALRLGIPTAQIMDALGALLPAMKEFRPSPESSSASMETSVGVELSPAARDAAMKLVRCEQVLERIVSGVESLGWVGEPDTKALVVLAAISRLSPDPLWTVLTATTSGERFPGLGVLAAITPAEHLVHVSRLTDNALVYADPEGLRHKLLIIDDAAGLSPSVATALRILHTRGSLTGTQVVRDPIRGDMRTRFLEARGPVAVITATIGSISEPLQSLLVEIPVDESSAQVEQQFEERRRRLALPANQNRSEVISALQNAQRVLVVRPVVVPNVEHLNVPSIVARSRALQDAFVSLITASALLHQYQRLTMDGCVVADARDHAIALRLVMVLVSHRHADLSHRAHRLLTALRVGRHETFTVATVSRVIPEWPRSTIRRALDDLIRADEVVALRSKIGCVREYRLVAMTTEVMTAHEGGHLATPGQTGWPPANEERAHG